MAEIHYIRGDATHPQISGTQIICHCCNDLGSWGRGFVLALLKRWPAARDDYKAWHASQNDFKLGAVQYVLVEPHLWVVNLVGQEGIRSRKGVPPIRYAALEAGMTKVAAFAASKTASVHMPRIGCGLAGGQWPKVEAIIQTTLLKAGIKTYVYDL